MPSQFTFTGNDCCVLSSLVSSASFLHQQTVAHAQLTAARKQAIFVAQHKTFQMTITWERIEMAIKQTGRIGQASGSVDAATHHQNQLGLFGLLTGRTSRHWSDAQHAHHTRQKVDKLPCQWASPLVKQFFLAAWDLWKDWNDTKHSLPTAAERREMTRLDDTKHSPPTAAERKEIARLDEETEKVQQASTSSVAGHDAALLTWPTAI